MVSDIPQQCSWCWRKILKLIKPARKFIKFKVGSVYDIYLWLDNCHPSGILYEKNGFRVVYDARSNLDTKLSDVLVN